ncbi:MAG: CotH kinase family protein, partial [Planctomycetota bacterium]
DQSLITSIVAPEPNATLLYTTNGTLPTDGNARVVLPSSADAVASQTLSIDTTTILQVVAEKQGWVPSLPVARSYLFIEDILGQSASTAPTDQELPLMWEEDIEGDYGMDPSVVSTWDDFNPTNDDFGIRESLKSLPTISLVMDHDGLWGEDGIYINSEARTPDNNQWERVASVEIISDNLYFDAAALVEMHGNFSRLHAETLKHSMRFKLLPQDLGNKENLRPLGLGIDALQDSIALKASFQDDFPGNRGPLSGYIRDTWMRQTLQEMGYPQADSSFAHLYLNGMYWGIVAPTERITTGFVERRLDEESASYDVLYSGSAKEADGPNFSDELVPLIRSDIESNATYQKLQGNHPDGTPDENGIALLDIENFVDFMLPHLVADASDFGRTNWYSYIDRESDATGFRFLAWDQERFFEPNGYHPWSESYFSSTLGGMLGSLRANEEFRLTFADHVFTHLFGDGSLTIDKMATRWRELAEDIEPAIVAESARWSSLDSHTIDTWRSEIDHVAEVIIPSFWTSAMQLFRDRGLYLNTEPPTALTNGSAGGIELFSEGGTILFTTDGSDPRKLGGTVGDTAEVYA